MKHFHVILLCLFSQPVLADLIVKQTITNKNDISRSTQYFSGAMFRMDLKSKDMEFISIVKGETIINCQKSRDASTKGHCTIGNLEQAKDILGMATIKIKDYDVKKLNQTGNFAGQNCQFFQSKMTLDIKIMGVATSSKTSDKFCVDQTIKIPTEFLAYNIMSTFRGAIPKKQFDDFIAKSKKANGLILYRKSKIDAKTQIDLVQSAAKIFGGDSRAREKSTVITETVSLKKTSIPKSQFQIPSGDYEVQDLTKKSGP